MPELDVEVREVKALTTRSGNTRFVLVDEGGNEYSTFKERSRATRSRPSASGLASSTTRTSGTASGTSISTVSSRSTPATATTAAASTTGARSRRSRGGPIDAAPYLVGEREAELPPEELFDRLQPFNELVADDIRDGDEAA
jgi:hypothetical protein